MLYTPQVKTGTKKKLSKLSEGPYRVIKKLSPVNYKIIKRNGKGVQVVHIDRLRLFIPRQPFPEWKVIENEIVDSDEDFENEIEDIENESEENKIESSSEDE